tara:strand:+ start:694 stop:1086 length:393 start_codon:yes stop_codon:yes gene_type:complete
MKLNTYSKILMTISALFLGIIGIFLSFLPKEIINYLNINSNVITILLFQLLGALYLGFGILNWMLKGSRIGGIYNRPVLMGNLMHFLVGAIALIKIVTSIQAHSEIIIFLMIVYSTLSISFAILFKSNPT